MADHRIGIIGAGLIVEQAHLPAYQTAGFDVASIHDLSADRSVELGAKFGIPHVASIEEMLSDPTITVVDIAVTPQAQQFIAKQVIDAGKDLLCQKPLATNIAEAASLVQYAAGAGRKLAVNQQMRWEPTVQVMKDYLDQGLIGEPLSYSYKLNLFGEYPKDHWLSAQKRYMALYGTIHYVDSARYLFGEPDRVASRLLTDPTQNAVGETWINAWIEWKDGPFFTAYERYTSRTGSTAVFLQLEGTKGSVRGQLGIYKDYPNPNPDHVEFLDNEEGEWRLVSDDGYWLPHSFAEPMRGLMNAIDDDTEPPTAGRDNLYTLRVMEAVYASNETGAWVRPEDLFDLPVGGE